MTILATDRATEEVALAADRKPIEFGDYSTGEWNSDGQTVRFGSKAAVDAKWDRRPVCPDSRHDTRLIDLRLRANTGSQASNSARARRSSNSSRRASDRTGECVRLRAKPR